jgi:hypothetical protein
MEWLSAWDWSGPAVNQVPGEASYLPGPRTAQDLEGIGTSPQQSPSLLSLLVQPQTSAAATTTVSSSSTSFHDTVRASEVEWDAAMQQHTSTSNIYKFVRIIVFKFVKQLTEVQQFWLRQPPAFAVLALKYTGFLQCRWGLCACCDHINRFGLKVHIMLLFRPSLYYFLSFWPKYNSEHFVLVLVGCQSSNCL